MKISKENFIKVIEKRIEQDYHKLYYGYIPDVLLTNQEKTERLFKKMDKAVKKEQYKNSTCSNEEIRESICAEIKQDEERKGNIKQGLKDAIRLNEIRLNISIDMKNFRYFTDNVLNENMLDEITDSDKEPHHYEIFLNTLEEINFFVKSKIMKYNNLFAIKKDKYDGAILELEDKISEVSYYLHPDTDLKIRIPINPKITIAKMIDNLSNDKELSKAFFHLLNSYYNGGQAKKTPSVSLFDNFWDNAANKLNAEKTKYSMDTFHDELYFYTPKNKSPKK